MVGWMDGWVDGWVGWSEKIRERFSERLLLDGWTADIWRWSDAWIEKLTNKKHRSNVGRQVNESFKAQLIHDILTIMLSTSWSNLVLLNVTQTVWNEFGMDWMKWLKTKKMKGNSFGILWVSNGKTTVRTNQSQRFAVSPYNVHEKYSFPST